MIIQISSGQGPTECEFAVRKLLEVLQVEYPDIEVLSTHPSKNMGCFTSVLFDTDVDLTSLEGSIQWICQSPFRPHHKRKNWFVDISIIPEVENICTDQENRMDCFHCCGKGGQNVNKVETGVRLIHIPTGITLTSTAERTQQLNRKNAMNKLNIILRKRTELAKRKQVNSACREHNRIIRGNPIRVYQGMNFKRVH